MLRKSTIIVIINERRIIIGKQFDASYTFLIYTFYLKNEMVSIINSRGFCFLVTPVKF